MCLDNEKKLYHKMKTDPNGYNDRPDDKPITSHWISVEVSEYKMRRHARNPRPTPYPSRRRLVQQIIKVEGLVTPCITTNRKAPPNAASGVDLAYSGFDKGHVIGLELGGVDDSYNIVPQCRYWQQSGEWRKMEKSILAIIKDKQPYVCFMTVDIKYGRDPTNPIEFNVNLTENQTPLFHLNLINNWSSVDEFQQDQVLERLDNMLR